MRSSATPASKPTRRRSRSRASSATTRASSGPRSSSTRGLPRPLDRHAVGHRQPEGAGRLRPAGRRLRARAAERPGGDRRRRAATQPERGGRVPRRRSRAKAASTRRAGTTCRACAALRRAGLAADARRGAVRHRPHRQVVRAPVGRHPARRDAAGQGPGLGRADRRGGVRPEGGQRVRPGQPRHHLRRQPAGDARRRRDAAHHGRRRPAGQRGHASARCCKAGLRARIRRPGRRRRRSAARA